MQQNSNYAAELRLCSRSKKSLKYSTRPHTKKHLHTVPAHTTYTHHLHMHIPKHALLEYVLYLGILKKYITDIWITCTMCVIY